MKIFGRKAFLKAVVLATAGVAASGCTYDTGLGYASDGYYSDYACDPYGGYDIYYDCDYRSGFYNIGFGGGWYDSYFYPGYGYYLFDNYGRRHAMRDNHRRYWGEKRHNWYRENGGRDRDRQGYRGRGYSNGATPGAIGWPKRNGDDNSRGRGNGQGRRARNDQWRGGEGNSAAAAPTPNPDYARGRGDGPGRARSRDNGTANALPQPNRAERQRAPQPSSGQGNTRAARSAPPPLNEGRRHEAPRYNIGEGGADRPD